jgi:hypothetical protein
LYVYLMIEALADCGVRAGKLGRYACSCLLQSLGMHTVGVQTAVCLKIEALVHAACGQVRRGGVQVGVWDRA